MSDPYEKQLEKENAALMESIKALREKVQHLVDTHCEEHNCEVFTFPNGEEWKRS